ncbi:hypothetical protein [Nannocystis radixulma]|uniref:Uncharacterized protein n=1 Tax=Nannocystis radixulma TaxID=2995305 RepID=A0ABT5BGX6_9BACT|nr:hypothetical protein [Nannocystis radixulma]MDC0672880.1 hypothetical protein [Nannocystis radixulma]
MDPKQQAAMFYNSLAAADAFACKLLAQGARMQRGRVASLESRLEVLKKIEPGGAEVAALETEIAMRAQLAKKFDALDEAITKALDDRAALDKGKFG